jgi:hypothetical protein
MIRYDIDFGELARAIDVTHPTWRRRAATAIRRMRASTPRVFDPRGPSWADIKHHYIVLQHHKCAYCERRLEAEDYGAIEHDVEHYRPKRSVSPWRGSDRHIELSDGNRRGYCMLAYELRNYCAVCKTCNTTRKRDYFPIAGKPGRVDARDIAKLNASERPMLPYPLGQLDDDPETIIKFVGFLPIARSRSGHRRRRALVTIDLLALRERLELTQGRCMIIQALWLAIRAASSDDDPDERRLARRLIEDLLSGRRPHTACARAFVRLFEADPAAACVVHREACEHLRRSS